MGVFTLVLLCFVGVVLLGAGAVMWKKQKVSFMHSYHYENLAKEDVPVYTKRHGIALMLLGVGTIAMSFFMMFNFDILGIVILFICYTISGIMFVKTQRKYNGSIF